MCIPQWRQIDGGELLLIIPQGRQNELARCEGHTQDLVSLGALRHLLWRRLCHHFAVALCPNHCCRARIQRSSRTAIHYSSFRHRVHFHHWNSISLRSLPLTRNYRRLWHYCRQSGLCDLRYDSELTSQGSKYGHEADFA